MTLPFALPLSSLLARNHCEAAFKVEVGDPGRLHPVPRYLTVEGEVPKRTLRRRAALIRGLHDLSTVMRSPP